MRTKDGHAEAGGNGKANDIEGVRQSNQDQPSEETSSGIVRVACPRDDSLAFESGRENVLGIEGQSKQVRDRERRRDRRRGATSHPACERKSLSEREPQSVRLSPAGAIEDRSRRDGRRILVRISRQAAIVSFNLDDRESGLFHELHRHRIARRLEGKTEDIEPASDVGDGGGGKSGRTGWRCGHPWARGPV